MRHALLLGLLGQVAWAQSPPVKTGKAALGDWTQDAPGVTRRLTVAALPPPNHTPSSDSGANVVKRPPGAWPRVPAGFTVTLFSDKAKNPRALQVAPNGDLFVAESKPGRIHVFRASPGSGAPRDSIFASGLEMPFGLAFYPPTGTPQYLYVGETGRVRRFKYSEGMLEAGNAGEVVVPNIPSGGRLRGGGHWTRDLAFSRDAKTMFVSVGSHSNVMEDESPKSEERRADILAFDPDGKHERIYASGIRNAVGITVHPVTGELWASVNERDELGDDLVPDYVTHVKEGGFYGWPWFYLGAHADPRHPGAHPELASRVIVPDVLLQAHSASLQMTFYRGEVFPAPWSQGAFAAEHGSWNRARRTGYKVVQIPVDAQGHASGEYRDFLTGFVTPKGDVWGRPVGVAEGKDGSLYVSDDAGDCIWRVAPR